MEKTKWLIYKNLFKIKSFLLKVVKFNPFCRSFLVFPSLFLTFGSPLPPSSANALKLDKYEMVVSNERLN